jgi:hypothetical protein
MQRQSSRVLFDCPDRSAGESSWGTQQILNRSATKIQQEHNKKLTSEVGEDQEPLRTQFEAPANP